MRITIVLIVVVVAVTSAALLYYASPQRSIREMREAMAAGDAARASEYIDYEALRSSFKAQFNETVRKRLSSNLAGNSFAVPLGQKLVEMMLAEFVSPEGLRMLMQGNLAPRRGDTTSSKPVLPDYRSEFHSFSSYTATARADDKDVVYRFRRTGLSWKLIEVHLPEEGITLPETPRSEVARTQEPETPKWELTKGRAPTDGSQTILLKREAEEPIIQPYDPTIPALMIRCSEGRTELFVHTGMLESRHADERHSVRIRLDDAVVRSERWALSISRETLFAPNPKQLIRELRTTKVFLFEFTPRQTGPQVARFHVDDFDSYAIKIRQPGGW